MSKTYIVSRNGGTVTKAPVNDNKIPIYANETALDADLANIPDNTLVATRGGHDDVIDQMKDYIRKQNELSDWEDITIGDTSATATEMRYDGFLKLGYEGNDSLSSGYIYVNGEKLGCVRCEGYNNASGYFATLPIKKGDVVYTTNNISQSKVCYYKLRDYTGRQI